MLEAGFSPGPNMCEGNAHDLPWLRFWAPEALVSPLGLALSLADQKRRGLLELPSLNTAIIVLTSVDDSPLADHHRDLLWGAFGVPIFEQLRGENGTVIASECEVHDGLHFRDNEAFTLEGEIVSDPCACGLETPRLRSRSAVHSKSARAIAGR